MRKTVSCVMLVLLVICMLSVAFKIQPIKAGLTATVEVIPASYTVPNVGLTFNASVTVQGVEDLYGWQLMLYYPNDMLNGTSVAEGPFLKTGGNPTDFLVANFTDSYNATCGLLNVLCLRIGNVPGVNGNGTLVTTTFKSTWTGGPKTLHLADVKLSDSNVTAIPSITADGEVTVTGATIPGDINHDLKVNLQDLVLLANAYGSRPGDPNWNPNADINGNGVVGLSDLVILATHYGQHSP